MTLVKILLLTQANVRLYYFQASMIKKILINLNYASLQSSKQHSEPWTFIEISNHKMTQIEACEAHFPKDT